MNAKFMFFYIAIHRSVAGNDKYIYIYIYIYYNLAKLILNTQTYSKMLLKLCLFGLNKLGVIAGGGGRQTVVVNCRPRLATYT
jgi:hypothetical protein